MSHQESVEYGSGLEFSNLLSRVSIILYDAAKFGENDIIVFINVMKSILKIQFP